jgi:hypothetical protein
LEEENAKLPPQVWHVIWSIGTAISFTNLIFYRNRQNLSWLKLNDKTLY